MTYCEEKKRNDWTLETFEQHKNISMRMYVMCKDKWKSNIIPKFWVQSSRSLTFHYLR